MKRALAGVLLAVLAGTVVVGVPTSSEAASDSPVISMSSTSYSGQPRPYTVTVFNRLDNSKLTATISNGGTRAMSCRPAGAINGLGTWRCTSGSRLSLGSIKVTATAKSGGTTRTATRTANVSSRFRVGGASPSSVNEGGSFTVSGTRDHISGANDFSVRASVNGTSSSCSTSGSSFTCSLRAPASITGTSQTLNVTVTESGPGGSRSGSTSVQVVGQGTPGTPRISSPTSVGAKKPQPLTIKGSTNAGGLTVQLLVDPGGNRNWAAPDSTCTSSGGGAFSCTLSEVLTAGRHTIVARAIDPSDPSRVSPESSFGFRIEKPKATPPAPTPTPTPTPTAPPVEEPPAPPEPETPEPEATDGGLNGILELLVLALAVLTLARPGALTRDRTASSASFTGRNPAEENEVELVGWGDQSPTWAAFGTDATDYWSRMAPPALARWSPFMSRLFTDGVGIRAMFGSLWWLLQLGGIALGVLAASDTGGKAAPPSLGLLAGLLVIGSFDAMAGFLGTVAFTVLVAGDLDGRGFAVVVVLGFLWTAMPLVAELLRPLRRTGTGWRYRWDRLADLVIVALVCGWLANRIADGMDVLANAPTGLPAKAGDVALIAGAAIAGRVLLGTLVDLGYPERVRATMVYDDMPETRPAVAVLGFAVRMLLFAVVGHALIGSCWQLWVGLLLFAVPDLLAGLRTRSALAPTLRTGLPAGLTQLLVLVVWSSLVVALAISSGDGDADKLRIAFVAAGVLPAVFGLAQVLADPDADRPATSWRLQLIGAGVVAATFALALHGWNY